MNLNLPSQRNWLNQPIKQNINISWVSIIIFFVLVLAFVSRIYLLEARVMSHDETIHVYHNAWTLYRGSGYQHDPLSHGPLQTLLVAFSYFIFGDSDFSARIPAALFSIATVMFVWNFRRYIGKTGAIIAMVLMLISPYMLYYGRYVRNDAFAAFFGVVSLWAVLRYLETGKDRYTYFLTVATVLHFTAKETAFIYTAIIMLFLAGYFVFRITISPWEKPGHRGKFLLLLIILLILVTVAGGYLLVNRGTESLNPFITAAPAVPGEVAESQLFTGPDEISVILLGLIAIFLILCAYFLITGYSWNGLRKERSFGLLILLITFVLPQLSAFAINFMGWHIPTNATQVKAMTSVDIIRFAGFLVPMFILSIAIGLVWNGQLWLKNAALFYGIFVIIYTTVFTNGAGFFTGLVGSLGYWLEQQGVKRGSQPWYYYIGVQIPIYEYLPALSSVLAVLLGIKTYQKRKKVEKTTETELEENQSVPLFYTDEKDIRATTFALLTFFTALSLLAFTVAGEKMPWLTVHMTWPMILLGSWGLGRLVDGINWGYFKNNKGVLIILLLVIFLISAIIALGSLIGSSPPFQGKDLQSLQNTSTFLLAAVAAVACGVGVIYLTKRWTLNHLLRIVLLLIFCGMAFLTSRTAYQASFINYDYANELLVYAHSAPGVKIVMDQIEEISKRTTDGLALSIAHDGEYPFWWYLRNYTNTTYYGENPTRSLRDNSVIITGANNYGKIEHVVGQGYQQYDYIRLWWPNQDYFNLNLERIIQGLSDPNMRGALFQIWLNRDYTKYGEVTGKDMSAPNWQPSNEMRFYLRKDIVSQLWNYGVAPVEEEIQIDPYEGRQVQLSAQSIIGSPGSFEGQFQRPRGVAGAADGSIFVADTENNRIQHITSDGEVVASWGIFGDAASGQALGGSFNQPWGIAVGPDQSVYVADTWNHRVQKFSPDGEFIRMWGYFGQAETPEAFWGPRDVEVDEEGRVFVTDTGNKRIVVFDSEGNYLTEFGEIGFEPGYFDEPVGIAVDNNGYVYVADTWNQRIQVFTETPDGEFVFNRSWDVIGWYGQSLDNKPYLDVDGDGNVYVTDPEGYRVLVFNADGELILYWGDYGTGDSEFGLTGGISVLTDNAILVTDAGNSRLMIFNIPPLEITGENSE